MMEYKRSGRYTRPFVNVYSITFDHVVPEMDQIRRFCDEIGVDQLTFRPDERPGESRLSQARGYSVRPLGSCFWPWLTLNVDADGSVYPCPIAFRRRDRAYGNVNEQSIDRLWNNQLFVETRRFLGGKSSVDSTTSDTIPCHSCPWYGAPSQERIVHNRVERLSEDQLAASPTSNDIEELGRLHMPIPR